ncbi:hypothetical protein [Hominifimenecus microfluidus]|nr:hypothetical protein [Hominifimenecus microfluidus]
MELIGQILGISADMVTQRYLITIAVPALPEIAEQSRRLAEGNVAVQIGRYRKPRSLDANAYHWLLCSRIAAALETDTDSVHYDLMLRYGTPRMQEDGNASLIRALPQVNLRKEQIYGRWLRTEETEGRIYDHYLEIKPSHEYDSAEMTALIRGTIEEADDLGIVTDPQRVRDLMEALREK